MPALRRTMSLSSHASIAMSKSGLAQTLPELRRKVSLTCVGFFSSGFKQPMCALGRQRRRRRGRLRGESGRSCTCFEVDLPKEARVVDGDEEEVRNED